jgi:transcriptional regulator with XRE-family HTH domain
VDTDDSFRQRLQQARLALGVRRGREVRQQEVAEMLGMNDARVNRYFRDVVPSLEVIAQLARALEVDPGWLAFGEDSKAPTPSFMPPTGDGGVDDPPPNEARAKKNLSLARAARKPRKSNHRRSG